MVLKFMLKDCLVYYKIIIILDVLGKLDPLIATLKLENIITDHFPLCSLIGKPQKKNKKTKNTPN